MNQHDSIQTLIQLANHIANGVEVRKGAILGLGHAGGHEARAALARIAGAIQSGAELRAAAATALGMAALRE